MKKDPVEAYRNLLDLPSDWQPDWNDEKWNWFKIGWDAHLIESHSQSAPNEENAPARAWRNSGPERLPAEPH